MANTFTKIFPTKSSEALGVVLVAHGANLSPARMDELCLVLQAAGYTALRPGFTGHNGDVNAFAKVSAEDWLADARHFYQEAKELADAAQAPLYLVAYSFSAPIFMQLQRELLFDKRILFAPAFEVKWWYPAFRALAWSVPPGMGFESKNMADYRASNFVSAASARALDTILTSWKRRIAPSFQDTIPTLVFMDPEDELLSYRATKKFLRERSLPHWQLENVSTRKATNVLKFHHLIIDSGSVGEEEWRRISKVALQFLE